MKQKTQFLFKKLGLNSSPDHMSTLCLVKGLNTGSALGSGIGNIEKKMTINKKKDTLLPMPDPKIPIEKEMT